MRLKSVVSDRPKPMAEVGSQPFLELQIEYCKRYGITDFVFCIGFMHEQVQEHFGDGSRWDVSISYSVEQQLLGTGGALRNASALLGGAILVLNGDSFKEVDLREVISFHERKSVVNARAMGTIVLTTVANAREFGSVSIDAGGKILAFTEKSSLSRSGQSLINAGIYVLAPDFLDRIPCGRVVSLEREVFPAVLASGEDLFGYPVAGFFADIGTPLGYRRFQEYIKERQA